MKITRSNVMVLVVSLVVGLSVIVIYKSSEGTICNNASQSIRKCSTQTPYMSILNAIWGSVWRFKWCIERYYVGIPHTNGDIE